jgi:hypothetical protein
MTESSSFDASRLGPLIELLRDRTARIDERDDAAMDLGDSDDPRAIEALLAAGSDPNERDVVAASCGVSLAAIAVRTGNFDQSWSAQLVPIAANELMVGVRIGRADVT